MGMTPSVGSEITHQHQVGGGGLGLPVAGHQYCEAVGGVGGIDSGVLFAAHLGRRGYVSRTHRRIGAVLNQPGLRGRTLVTCVIKKTQEND